MLIPTLSVLAVAALVCAAPMLLRWIDQRRLGRLCAARRTLVLTYDDGPGSGSTPRVLEVLRRHGARATFFVLGRCAEAHPDLLDSAKSDGHEIGCHSYAHVNAWKSWPWAPVADVGRGYRAIARWVAADGIFRPPYGKLTPVTWAVARLCGRRLGWWTLDSGDTWDTVPDAEDVVRALRARGGAVVLLHDFERDEERTAYMLDVTERLLRAAEELGLRVETLGGLLDDAPRR